MRDNRSKYPVCISVLILFFWFWSTHKTLGDFLTESLTLLVAYAFAAFECFQIMEQRPCHIDQLRFCCQYWIIFAIVMIVETVGVFVQWIPLYGKIKLAFFVYLLSPKTKGTDVVYDTFLRPYVMQYKPDIEQRLSYLRANNAGKLIAFYIKNFAQVTKLSCISVLILFFWFWSTPRPKALGDFLTELLTLLFAYAFPAFKCVWIIEQRPCHIDQLRFWCQYWIIVAIVMFVETVGVFVQWIPAYGELKLAFFVYLWYPKTKGADVVYDAFLRWHVMQYEPDIEQRLSYLRSNAGKIIVFYIKYCAYKGVNDILYRTNKLIRGFFSFRKKKEEELPSVSEIWQTALSATREKNEAWGRQHPHQNRYDDKYNYRYDDFATEIEEAKKFREI